MKLAILFAFSVSFVQGFVGGNSGKVGSQQPSFAMIPQKNSPLAKKINTITNIKYKCPHYYHHHHHHQSSKLFLSDIPMPDPDEERNMREKDPIQFLNMQVNSMDLNAIINTSIAVIVSLSVLNAIATVDAGMMRGWTTEEVAVRIPVDNWLSYSAVLEQSPLYTKAVTSATVYTIGDMISQGTEGKSIGEIDRPRVIRSLLAGLIGHGPLSHLWYDFSENIFENVMHLQGLSGTAIKVAIDQTTWGPFWNNSYILLLGLMKLEKIENIFEEMKRTTIPLLVTGLKLWPLAHCVTYGLIPVENRLLWVDLVEIIWVTILSTTAAAGDNNTDDAITAATTATEVKDAKA